MADKNNLVVFAEPLIEKAAAYQLGKEAGTISVFDLRNLNALFLCGDIPFDNWDDVVCYEVGEDDLYYKGMAYKGTGDVTSLSDLSMMPNLKEAAFYNQNISDISALQALDLTHLALSNNPVDDLTALSGMKFLKELAIVGTTVTDPSALTGCTSLFSIRIDAPIRDLTPFLDLPIEFLSLKCDNIYKDSTILERFTKLTELEISGLPVDDVMAVARLRKLQVLNMFGYPGYPLSTLDALQGLTELRQIKFENCSLNTDVPLDDYRQLLE